MFYRSPPIIMLLGIAFMVSTAGADDRRFTYLYDVETHPPGHVEYEQYVTLSWNKKGDPSFFRAAFRHEFEFGVTDNLQLAVYLADWRTTYTEDTGTKTEFRNSALELKYNLTNPTTDVIGLGLYGEFKIGNELFELEGKLLAQKNVEDWVFAYNFTIESEWEGRHYDEVSGKVKNYLGVAYQISPKLSIGGELLIDTPIPHWSRPADTRTYLGPTIAWHETGWFIAATMEFALYNVRGAERYQFRTIFGIDF